MPGTVNRSLGLQSRSPELCTQGPRARPMRLSHRVAHNHQQSQYALPLHLPPSHPTSQCPPPPPLSCPPRLDPVSASLVIDLCRRARASKSPSIAAPPNIGSSTSTISEKAETRVEVKTGKNKPRAKTGCLVCRSRRVKCDEAWVSDMLDELLWP